MSDSKSPSRGRECALGSLCAVILAVHLATVLCFAALFQVGNATAANGFFALLLGGQACLLGLWAGLAWRLEARRVVTCLAGLALGSVWLWALILTTTQTWHRSRIRWFAAQICATVIVTTFLATAALSRRYFELTLQRTLAFAAEGRPSQAVGYFLDLPTALFASGTAIVITATLLVFRLAGYRLVAKKRTDRLPSVGRGRFERRPVEDCGAKIAKWLAARSDLESTPRTSTVNRLLRMTITSRS